MDLSFSYGNQLWGIDGHRRACPRTTVARLNGRVPLKWIERLEQDQKLPHCCRHPENHVIEAWYSNAQEAGLGRPDIYKIICPAKHADSIRLDGEHHHVFFCVGAGDRPVWE